jgi:hypothetical protein
VQLVGLIIGSGRHRPDEVKQAIVADLSWPTTKKEVRRMVGYFGYFRCYVPHLAELCVPVTNILAKGKPNLVQ